MADYSPRMPSVKPLQNGIVQHARDLAFDPINRRLIMITPGRNVKSTPTLSPRSEMHPEFSAELETLAPANEQWLIVAIGMTDYDAVRTDTAKSIPFVTILEGLAQLGHAVILFEGHETAISEVCDNADLLILDTEMIPFLEDNWIQRALDVMRNDYILRVNRKGYEVIGLERLKLKK